MSIKFMGAIMIISVCVYAGFRSADRLKKRSVYLRNILTALNILETEIEFGGKQLKKAFETLDKSSDTRGIFRLAAEKTEALGIKRAWSEAVNEKKTELCLCDDDTEALTALGTRLGMTDTENQIKNISYVRELLTAQQETAEGEYKRLGRLYRSGGVLGGLFLVLILF
jgi:stage III sporulation protein AB